jgi:hypothetical protein
VGSKTVAESKGWSSGQLKITIRWSSVGGVGDGARGFLFVFRL